jgi:glycosyltransferase involved in cell wall biosynthesis
MNAKVSVCLTIRNGERFLKQQVESILLQLGEKDELICSDDHSDDNSVQILESINDPRIKITKPSSTYNHVKNFEHALQLCSGDLIFLSDHDDVWNHDKVAVMKEHLTVYDLVLSDCSIIDDRNVEMAPSLFKIQNTRKGLLKNCIKNTYTGCCMAFKRAVLDKALPFPNGIKAHDQWLGLVAEKYFTILHLPKPLVMYRRHKDNLSTTGEKSKLTWLEQVSYRITLLRNLSLR